MRRGTKMRNNSGLTIFETLIAVMLLLILIAVGAPVIASSQKRENVASTVLTAATNVKRAQFLSRTRGVSFPYGVRIQTGQITLFQGATFASRNTALDEVITTPSTVVVTGTADYIFTWNNTLTSTTGTTTFTSNQFARTLNLNAIGMVTY